MKKYLFLIILIISGIVLFLVNPFKEEAINKNEILPKEEITERATDETEPTVSMANPASKYCEENGGSLEMVTNKDGSQFGLCKFDDYACEEWAYFRNECAIEEDAEKIKQALIKKGLDLTDMKVVINHHLGKYMGGSVVPISEPAGGGYVFAVKEGNEVKIVADGNGVIMCEMLSGYPDYPTYLIAECVDENGTAVTR